MASAGLMRVSLSTGAVSLIAYGPPYSPRDVAIDASGDYIAVEQPTGSGAQAVGLAAVYRVTPGGQVTVVAPGRSVQRPARAGSGRAGQLHRVGRQRRDLPRDRARGRDAGSCGGSAPGGHRQPGGCGRGRGGQLHRRGCRPRRTPSRHARRHRHPESTRRLRSPSSRCLGRAPAGPAGWLSTRTATTWSVDWNARAVFRVRGRTGRSPRRTRGPAVRPRRPDPGAALALRTHRSEKHIFRWSPSMGWC